MDITFKITVPNEQVLKDTAKELGYQETIQVTEDKEKQVTYKDIKDGNIQALLEPGAFAIAIQEGYETNDDSPVTVKYKLMVEKPNPQTVKEFFRDYFVKEFINKYIKPVTIRAKTRELEEQIQQAKKQVEEELEEQINIDVV